MAMVGSWEQDHKEIPEQLYSLSMAYLESAVVLCERLIDRPTELTFDRGRVAISLGRHSAELFLKAAILQRDPSVRLHHDLEDLKQEYGRLYPGRAYKFEMPFRTEVLGFDDEDVDVKKKQFKRRMPHDQLFRYPMNKAKKGWQGVPAFDAESFADTLNRLRADYDRLRPLLFGEQASTN